jgi:hypothetical protein
MPQEKKIQFMTDLGPDYEAMGEQIGILLSEKQSAYGDAFGNMSRIFDVLYPSGIQPHQYGDILTIARVMDKVFRIANLPTNKKDSMGEDPWRDIAGYAMLALQNSKEI